MCVRSQMDCGSDRFFMRVNARATKFDKYFKRQHLGRNAFARIVGSVYEHEGITGSGVKRGMTLHGLGGSVVTLLFEDGQKDVNLAMRTGHRDLASLKHYHNLRGALGMQQQAVIFGDSEPKKESAEAVCGGHDEPDGKENIMRNGQGQGQASPKDLDSKRQKVGALCRGNGGVDRKQNITSVCQRQALSQESNTAEDSNFRLPSGVKNISDGVFTINVNNHYR